MILAINYSDARFRPAQILNSKCARKFGADEVIEYTYESLLKSLRSVLKTDFNTDGAVATGYGNHISYWMHFPRWMMVIMSCIRMQVRHL